MYSHSYFTLTARSEVADGRNRAQSNYAPRALGSAASPLLRRLEPDHYGVQVTPREKKLVRLWIETGAPYPGTYAALGTGMIGSYAENQPERPDAEWPSTHAAAQIIPRRCGPCHVGRLSLPLAVSHEHVRPPWELLEKDDPRRRLSRHLLYNLSRPEKSMLLLAPLAKAAGGMGLCRPNRPSADTSAAVPPGFADRADSDYRVLLTAITDAKQYLERIKRFDMPDFRPRPDWVREMKRYGILPSELGLAEVIDVYAAERRYWASLWYQPAGK
jgi:hypothetical protein